MKIRGFVITLIVVLGVVFLIFYLRVGDEQSVAETYVGKAVEAQIRITGSALDALAREIVSASVESGLPREIGEMRRLRPQFAVPMDAWGTEVKYEVVSETGFRLTSAGPDRAFGTADDISKEY